MKYEYREDIEAFVRVDGLGKKLWINSSESQRIMTLYNLGNSVSEIRNKITFNSRKVSESTINNFINNVKNGDITIPDNDYVPVCEDLTIEERISNLENRVHILESHDCKCETDGSIKSKVKSWMSMK